MVQKKVAPKLAFQPHHVATQDVKSIKGPDLKTKKMKKSGSFKRQDQPGKPKPAAIERSPPRSATAPNYMKSTSSFDARKEVSPKRPSNTKLALASASISNNNKPSKASSLKKTKNPSFKPSIPPYSSSVKNFCENLESQKATCCSTLKDSKFPDYLSLNSGGTELEGTSIIKVCPYTYCSLNGHHHVPLPPLKHFLSARRRTIKVQRNMKLLGCLSPRRAKGIIGNEPKFNEKNEDQEGDVNAMDFTGKEEVSVQEEKKEGFLGEELQVESMGIHVGFDKQDSEPSDMEWEIEGHLDYDYEYECSSETDTKIDLDGGELVKSGTVDDDEFLIKSDNIDGCFDDFSADEVSQESFEDEGFNSDAFSSIDDGEFTNSYDYPQTLNTVENPTPAEVPFEEPNESSDEDQTGNPEKNQENPSGSFINTNPTGRYNAKNEAKTETEDSALVLVITKGKDPTLDVDESGQYNPRAPNFLPLEPDPEAEKVDLKHQDLDERKNSEEWMVDYALRQVVTKLGPARKRKVALLVEAFEKVTPVKNAELHSRRASGFDQAKPMQTCS